MSDLTRQAIKASFRKLLSERPLARITVREIAADCGINRNTFYYHYHDIPELMEELMQDEAAALIAGYTDISSLEDCVEAAFRFIVDNRRSINHIFHSVKREVFEQYLMRICSFTITSWYNTAFPTGHGNESNENSEINENRERSNANSDRSDVTSRRSNANSDRSDVNSRRSNDSEDPARERFLRFLRYELFGACIDFMNEGMPTEAIDEAKHLLRLSLNAITTQEAVSGNSYE
ncbi:MAG: TetR family transcriptional regulator [Blautia sp.]|nr:TetR family transcriptional regulator [Blautia sp.]